LDIGQAVRRLRSGDKVRRHAWDADRHLNPETAADEKDPVVAYEDLLGDDWEIYEDEEPVEE
jgi:hypothetical protein